MTTIDSQPRYLVYRCGWQGLGHIGVAILNCVRAASLTGRTLALDMRDFHYYRQDAARRFAEHFAFELPSGSTIVTDPDAVREICALPDRYEPPAWQGQDVLLPRPERVVIITSDVVRHVHTQANKFAFWPNRMILRGALADRVRTALLPAEPQTTTIGVYFRSGNGEFLDFRFDPISLPDYASRYEELVERYADIARLAARQFPGRRIRYYVASDSAAFVAAMRGRLDGVISHGQGGIGGMFRSIVEAASDGLDAVSDATIDVWNLSQCDSLVYNPSLFPELAILNGDQLSAETVYCIEPSTLRSVVDRLGTEAALEYLDRAFSRQPLFWWRLRAGILRFRIDVLERDGRTETIEPLTRRAEQLEACFGLDDMREALGLMERQRPDEAREKALSVAAADHVFVTHFIAVVEFFLGRPGEALARIETALDAWPDLPELHLARVQLLAALGRVGEAARAAGQAIEACGMDPALSAERERMAARDLGGGRVLRNVAIGCRAQQSSRSRWSQPDDPAGLVNGVALMAYQMHTENEDSPWWSVDLGRRWPVRRIVVYNRDDEAYHHIAENLLVEGMNSDGLWMELGRARRRFTGARGGDPLSLWFDTPPTLRAVRLRLEGRFPLHLQQVEVFAIDTEAV